MTHQILNKKAVNLTPLVFWSFAVVLISAISTNIFSETSLNDNLAIGFMVVALIGLVISAASILIQSVLDICNP
ncbi:MULTISPECIES: hypothetical protein [unclassified Acinetobacter]|uniref:hypothetical protein n=1 Tax=unclassified Acinetobacter TaxID=196816 RepID=UPI0015D45231|nr:MULTISPECIES: hypothetical protein [unclassified Acinetobacter]